MTEKEAIEILQDLYNTGHCVDDMHKSNKQHLAVDLAIRGLMVLDTLQDTIKATYERGVKDSINMDEKIMKITDEDFGILAVCAIRYCQGRQTYMPELVRGIIRSHIDEVSDKDLQVMINDCERQYDFGDENIDKPRWLEWKDFLIKEQNRRQE